MLRRLLFELKREIYWLKKDIVRRWRLDTPIGVVGIIVLVSALALFGFVFQGVVTIIRASIPWVKGSTVGTLYWSSLTFALKFSFVFVLFCGSLILFFVLKIHSRR